MPPKGLLTKLLPTQKGRSLLGGLMLKSTVGRTTLPTAEPLLNVGWAPKQTIGVTRAGAYDQMFYPNRYDVVQGGANPFGVWLQGATGTPRPGIKAQTAREVMSSRPEQYQGTVTFDKPMTSVGEVADRDALSKWIEGAGADGMIYNDVYDNGFDHNQVIHSFIKPELVDANKSAVVKYYGPTMGKSFAAQSNPNLIDLDTWGMPEYNQLAQKYGYKDWREMILSDKGDYNQEYKALIKDQIRRIQADPQYNGKTIVVSNASLLKPDSGITFANTPLIPERGILAFRNHQRHPWESIEHGEQWWDSLQQKGTPLTIDNRYVSDIELAPGNTTLFHSSFSPEGKTYYGLLESPIVSKSIGSSSVAEQKFNSNELLGEIGLGKRAAGTFFQHPVVQASEQHNIDLAKRLGVTLEHRPDNISEIVTAPIKFRYIDNPGLELGNIGQSYLGDPNAELGIGKMSMSVNDARGLGLHEMLHRGFYGGPIRPKDMNMSYFQNIFQPSRKFYRWKVDKLLKPEFKGNDSYIGDVSANGGEAGPNLINIGKDLGLRLGSRYPGDTEFLNMMQNYNGNKQFLINQFDLDSRAGRRHIWDAMTGQYFEQGGTLKKIESGKSGIHIKPENKGKFTETKKRTGKTTEELTHSKNPLTRKRAIFAQNAKHWNKK